MPKAVPYLAACDFLLFVALWIARTLQLPLVRPWGPLLPGLYWLCAAVGFILSVYGFLVLTRAGVRQMPRSVVCVLFAMTPGCAALIGLLSRLGGHTAI